MWYVEIGFQLKITPNEYNHPRVRYVDTVRITNSNADPTFTKFLNVPMIDCTVNNWLLKVVSKPQVIGRLLLSLFAEHAVSERYSVEPNHYTQWTRWCYPIVEPDALVTNFWRMSRCSAINPCLTKACGSRLVCSAILTSIHARYCVSCVPPVYGCQWCGYVVNPYRTLCLVD